MNISTKYVSIQISDVGRTGLKFDPFLETPLVY